MEEGQEIKRGDIYYVYPSGVEVESEQYGGRPAIIVSNDMANEYSPVVEVVYLTTQKKNTLPTHVDILSSPRQSIALCEAVNSISKIRIGDYAGRCTAQEMRLVDAALCISLGLEPQQIVEVERKASADEERARAIGEMLLSFVGVLGQELQRK